MNKIKVVSAIVLVFILTCSVAAAESVMPRADWYFISATAFLADDGRVVFDLTTYDDHNRLYISYVWLEKKIEGTWITVKSLPAPANIEEDTCTYVAVVDYSSDIGTGTFRVGFTAYADGYTITRYSNSRAF